MDKKKEIKVLIRHLISRPFFQPLWKALYKLSIRGMNIGGGQEIPFSGELEIINFLANKMLNRKQVTVFDVGAHHGNYASEILSRIDSKVNLFCFEPSKQNFEYLKKRLGGIDNVKLLNFGFSNKEENATLYCFAEGTTVSSLYNRNKGEDLIKTDEINLKILDDFCRDEGIESIDFLKIDVEGHELKVLYGGQNLIQSNLIEFIQFEFGSPNVESRTYFQDIFYYLNPYYKIYRILNTGLVLIDKYSYDYEIFRCTNYLAISRTI